MSGMLQYIDTASLWKRLGRLGGGVVPYVDCICLEKGYKPAVNLSLRVRMRTLENIGDVVGVCYQPFDQEKETAEVLYRQLEEA